MRIMNDGDPICIFAGYKGEMTEFVEANPGLYRRITQKFNFGDYTAPQLAEMTRKTIAEQHFVYDDHAHAHLLAVFEGKVDLGTDEDGNPIDGVAGGGGGKASTSTAMPRAAPAAGEWACSVCTYLNEYSNARCLMCETPRHLAEVAPRPKARAVDPPKLRQMSSSQREMYGRVMCASARLDPPTSRSWSPVPDSVLASCWLTKSGRWIEIALRRRAHPCKQWRPCDEARDEGQEAPRRASQ